LFPKLLGMLIFPMCQSAEMYAGVLVQEFWITPRISKRALRIEAFLVK
jgi:hypothetical protein